MESDSEREDALGDYERMQRDLSTAGFREGAEKGQEAGFQSGFDCGYAEGFDTAYTLGKFNGIIKMLQVNTESSILTYELETCKIEDTKRGLCLICNEKSACSCKTPKDTSMLIKNQKEVTDKFLEEQKSKCIPAFEKAGMRSLLDDLA